MKRNDGVISDYEVIWRERFREFVDKISQLNDYVKKVLAMQAKEREECSKYRLERMNVQYQKSINREQDSVNEAPEKNYIKGNRSNIIKDSLGFKTMKKELLLRVLELLKKSNLSLR